MLNAQTVPSLIAALRSGNYKQTKGRLRAGKCFCFAGVACDVFDPTRWDEFGDYTSDKDRVHTSFMPDEVLKHFGFDDPYAWELVYANDDGMLTFAEIADKLEADLNAQRA